MKGSLQNVWQTGALSSVYCTNNFIIARVPCWQLEFDDEFEFD